jgi:hypothetical protein
MDQQLPGGYNFKLLRVDLSKGTGKSIRRSIR